MANLQSPSQPAGSTQLTRTTTSNTTKDVGGSGEASQYVSFRDNLGIDPPLDPDTGSKAMESLKSCLGECFEAVTKKEP